MARTFTHNFIRDDGSPVTVEYSVEGSYSPTTYSPMSGACGGDAPEFTIEKVWPNTPEYEELHRRRQALTTDGYGRTLGPLVVSLMSAESREPRPAGLPFRWLCLPCHYGESSARAGSVPLPYAAPAARASAESAGSSQLSPGAY